MKQLTIGLALVAALSLASLAIVPDGATLFQPQEDTRYFPETGHNLRGPYLAFFEAHGGEPVLGPPITEEFYDYQSGLYVQYLQNVRLEWHPENPEPFQIQLTLLGDLIGKAQPAILPDQLLSRADCTYFLQTRHSACFAFLDYYDELGGLEVLGYPIAEYGVENGLLVQYFQRARMEWHPERRPGQKVSLGPLGRIHFDLFDQDPRLLSPRSDLFTPQRLTDLRLSASVAQPVMRPEGKQTVYLVVLDQFSQPVADAKVELRVIYPSGQEARTPLLATSGAGVTRLEFDVASGQPGQYVTLELTVRAGSLTRTTSTSFLIWY